MKYVIVKEKTKKTAEVFEPKGYKTTPKNSINYGGIKVDEMIIINPSFIDKILKKKTKKKLEIYLEYLMSLLEEEGTGEELKIVLNDLARYKSIVKNNYRIYLEKKYFALLMKKIEMLEEELSARIVYKKTFEVEEEKETENRRSR